MNISTDVLALLSTGRCMGPLFFLPDGQLDRKLYVAVNKVLDALGGKWNRGKKAHVFGADCEPLIEACIETGEVGTPQELGWFPTPDPLAARLVSLADVRPEHYTLEPSAGEGAIAQYLVESHLHLCELDAIRADFLARSFTKAPLYRGDFLTYQPELRFNRIVMNPPFAKRADIHHVNHAYNLLADGGRLVAIMSAGVKFRQDKLTQAFRDQPGLRSIEELPAGSFKAAGTLVNTCIVILEK